MPSENTLGPWLILTLNPLSIRTEGAFALEHNDSRAAVPKTPEPPEASDSERTPSVAPEEGSSLSITFSELPKNVTTGYVLGSSNDCDIIIGKKSHGVSGRHLIITFDQHERLLMKDVSRGGSRVSYDDQPPCHRFSPFTWVLPPGARVVVQIGNSTTFSIRVPFHRAHSHRYRTQVRHFLNLAQPGLSVIDNPDVETGTSSAVVTAVQDDQNVKPVYIRGSKIGTGGQGNVWMAHNASTWEVCAVKEINSTNDRIRKEAATLQSLSHDHIVRYINIEHQDERTMLVMEFCAFGSLGDAVARRRDSFDIFETCLMLQQVSSALEYIHDREIIHRDVKPANILLRSRDPPHAVLADFGIAKTYQGTFASTMCGTRPYLAPELYEDEPDTEFDSRDSETQEQEHRLVYFQAIDIWALGVVGLEHCYGLPRRKQSNPHMAMTREVTKLSRQLPDDPLIKVFFRMLQQDPWERPTAQECSAALKDAYKAMGDADVMSVET